MKKRDRLEVIYDIVKVIMSNRGRIKPTHLMYKSNLSYKLLNKYLNELLNKKFIDLKIINDKKNYILTNKGKRFFNDYLKIKEFLKSYDLEAL